jgi:hypothetical protein
MRRKRSPKDGDSPADPAPVNPDTASCCTAVIDEPHGIEQAVRRRLLGEPQLKFSSLVIRRIRDGVCLEGVMLTDGDCPDVCSLAQSVRGVEQVLNHLVINSARNLPAKG